MTGQTSLFSLRLRLYLKLFIHFHFSFSCCFPLGTAMQMCLTEQQKTFVEDACERRARGKGMNEIKPKVERDRTGGNISKPEVISKLLHFLQTPKHMIDKQTDIAVCDI